MPDLDPEAIIGIIITLFLVLLLGYVFITVLSVISQGLAWLFGLIIAVFVIMILFRMLKER
jgi:membrane protein DedA with SNARE-associated domain